MAEQESEKMVNILRDMGPQCTVDGIIPDTVWETCQRQAKGLSRISRVFGDQAFVSMLLQLRQWGTHFRQTDVFRASALQANVIGTHGGVSDQGLQNDYNTHNA